MAYWSCSIKTKVKTKVQLQEKNEAFERILKIHGQII